MSTLLRVDAIGNQLLGAVRRLLVEDFALDYLDRQSLPVVASEVQKEIPLSNGAYARLQSLFLLGYCLIYAGGGRLVGHR